MTLSRVSHAGRQGKRAGKLPPLPRLLFSFLPGLALGTLLALCLSGEGYRQLETLLQGILQALQSGAFEKPSLLRSAFVLLRWPLAVLLLHLMHLDRRGIPAVFFLRGFLLSACIACLCRALAWKGWGLALCLLGVETLLSLPLLFALGSIFLGQERGQIKRPTGGAAPHSPHYTRFFALMSALLGLCILWNAAILPHFLPNLLALFGGD